MKRAMFLLTAVILFNLVIACNKSEQGSKQSPSSAAPSSNEGSTPSQNTNTNPAPSAVPASTSPSPSAPSATP